MNDLIHFSCRITNRVQVPVPTLVFIRKSCYSTFLLSFWCEFQFESCVLVGHALWGLVQLILVNINCRKFDEPFMSLRGYPQINDIPGENRADAGTYAERTESGFRQNVRSLIPDMCRGCPLVVRSQSAHQNGTIAARPKSALRPVAHEGVRPVFALNPVGAAASRKAAKEEIVLERSSFRCC